MAVNNNENFYDALGIDEDADTNKIKEAYRKKAKETHPDKGGDAYVFASIAFAYKVLSDPDARKEYDRFGSTSEDNDKEKAATLHLKSLIQNAVKQICKESSSRYIKLSQIVNKSLKQQIEQTKVNIHDVKQTIKALEKQLHKVVKRKKKDKKQGNIYDGVIADLVDEAKDYLVQSQTQKEMLEQALKIAQEYEDSDNINNDDTDTDALSGFISAGWTE